MRITRFITRPVSILTLSVSIAALHAHSLDHWTLRHTTPSNAEAFRSITYGNGLFVAVGGVGVIGASTNGINWITNYPVVHNLFSVTSGGGQFIAVGDQTILSSPDGLAWTPHSDGSSSQLRSVAYGNGRFIAIGFDGFPTVSTDGATWTQLSTPIPPPPTGAKLIFGNGLFLFAPNAGTNLATIDGTNWWSQPTGATNALYAQSFAGGVFVEVDIHGQTYSSANGTNWIFHGTNAMFRPSELAYGNGYWVAVDGDTPNYSPDLKCWTAASTGGSGLSIAFGNGTFITASKQVFQSDPLVQLGIAAPGTLQVFSPTGVVCQIQAADQLGITSTWQVITNLSIDSTPFPWTDPAVANHSQRYYRAVLP